MSRYAVEISRRAGRQLNALQRRDHQRIRAAIELLGDEPRPPNCKPLVGEPNLWRVRVGVFRIIYRIHDDRLVILVVTVGHRRDVYRR